MHNKRPQRDGLVHLRLILAVVFLGLSPAIGQANTSLPDASQPDESANKPPLLLTAKERYEQGLIQWAMNRAGLTREENPEGKRITEVIIVREDIIAESDPWPNFLNNIHVTSRDYIVRQELLLKKGDYWDEARIEETERNLRRLSVLAVAKTVACKSTQDDGVVLLVVTKDLWSIRLNTTFNATGTTLHQLDFFPTETNFLGRNKQLGIHFGVSQQEVIGPNRDHYVFGQQYSDPRVWGTRLSFSQSMNLYVNGNVPAAGDNQNAVIWRPAGNAGDLAGIDLSVGFGRPLFSLATQWGFSLSGRFTRRSIRSYRQNPNNVALSRGERPGLSLRTVEVESQGVTEAIPRAYQLEILSVDASVSRSYGLTFKHDFSLSVSASEERRRAPQSFQTVFDQNVIEKFVRTQLPRSSSTTRAGVSYQARGTRYIRLRNIQTFALTEDYLLGPQLDVSLGAGLDLDISRHSFFTGSISAAYRSYFAENMFTVALAGAARWQSNLSEIDPDFSGALANGLLGVNVRNVSPPVFVGRLHTMCFAQFRFNDLNRNIATLGADPVLDGYTNPGSISPLFVGGLSQGGLRGYPSAQFEGRDIFRVNVEYRTNPIDLWTFHAGLVGFYDGGAVFGGKDPQDVTRTVRFKYRQSVGLGLRGQFPQFDRKSFRLDLGIPLSGSNGSFGSYIAASFGQTF